MWANYAVYLGARVCHLTWEQSDKSAPEALDGEPFIHRWHKLWSELQDWCRNRPPELLPLEFDEDGSSENALLDANYPVWADRQRSNARKTPPVLLDLIADILDESRKAEKATTALYSGKPDAKKGRKGGGNKKSVKCDHCGKQGHKIDSCWVKYPEKRPPRTEPKGKRGAKKDNSNDAEGNEIDSALSVVCMRCGRTPPLEARKRHPCSNSELYRKHCTGEFRFVEFFSALEKEGLWPSAKPFEECSVTDLTIRISSAKQNLKHSCAAGVNCPLIREMRRLCNEVEGTLGGVGGLCLGCVKMEKEWSHSEGCDCI
jgi:hypothetical protein